jgi:hypothetical protein
MEIKQYFERKNPNDTMSEIIYRALQFETDLTPEWIKKIAAQCDPHLENEIVIIGVFGGVTRFRVRLEDAASTAFARFQYHLMNCEGNSTRINR